MLRPEGALGHCPPAPNHSPQDRGLPAPAMRPTLVCFGCLCQMPLVPKGGRGAWGWGKAAGIGNPPAVDPCLRSPVSSGDTSGRPPCQEVPAQLAMRPNVSSPWATGSRCRSLRVLGSPPTSATLCPSWQCWGFCYMNIPGNKYFCIRPTAGLSL